MPQSFRRKVTVALPKPVFLGILRHLRDSILARQAAVLTGVDQQAVGLDEGQDRFVRRAVGGIAFPPRIDHHANVEVVLLGEFVIAFVVRRNRHDRAGAVIEQDVVRHPDGHTLAAEGIQRVALGEDAMLLDRADVAGLFRLALLGDQVFDLGQQFSVSWRSSRSPSDVRAQAATKSRRRWCRCAW